MRLAKASTALGALALVGWVGTATLAQAAPMSFTTPLSGAQEVPPVKTPGHGTAHLTYNPSSRVLTYDVTYGGFTSSVIMAHIHGPAPAGKNAPVEIWLSKKGHAPSSPIKGEATLTETQAKQLMDDDLYINVHTKDHPPGAIRGQVEPPKS
ncbi:MAG: CHRD domain-containing protein [Acetobacteraceae bacterium]